MRAGTRYIVTTGEYSDYGIRDSFVALKTFPFDVTLTEWLAKHGEDGRFTYDSGGEPQDFLAFLRAEGLVADEPLNEVHLCDYNRPEPNPANDAADEVPS